MFMFRTRRTNLTRRLWKARRRRGNDDNNCRDAAGGSNAGDVLSLLKKLQDNQLEMLWKAIESGGQEFGNCVLMPRDRPQLSRSHTPPPPPQQQQQQQQQQQIRTRTRTPPLPPGHHHHHQQPPHFLCCQTWRWPDLHKDNELRQLPVCRSASDPVYVCCNPYHWSRIYLYDTPPPPYTRCPMDRKPEDRAPSETFPIRRDFSGSLTTNGEESMRNPSEWCKLAYWELTQRVGPLFPVESTAVNIFGDVPFGDGLSLETLAQHNCNAPESVRHTRLKIGLGVTVSQEDGCVWIYNRSDSPIFVNSLTLDNSDPLRVPSEQCLCVYDPIKAAKLKYEWDISYNSRYGPVDPNSIRISFCKGWGPNYSRQEITSCPCWIEILLSPCRPCR